MSTIPGSDTLSWNEEQTRFFLQLRLDENLKGNVRKGVVNDAGRQTIIQKFYEAFGEKHPWKKFGIKFTHCKKLYESYKKLTHNRTGIGYHQDGSINASEDWWNQRCQEWSGARKYKEKPVLNMDLMEKVFGTVHVTGGEGWAAQQGEEHLDTMNLDDNDRDDVDNESRAIPPTRTQDVDADAESRQLPPPTQANTDGPSSSSRSRTKGTRKRRRENEVAEVIKNSVTSRDKILAHKNSLIENHPEFSCSQLRAMEVLHSLPAIRMWSPLYKAAINHLKQDPTNRQTFLFYEEDENKVMYLEFATGVNRDA